jgi:NifU-like protein involved in Fe-S cluster formation
MDYSSEVVRRFRSPLRADVLADGLPGIVTGDAEDRSLNVWLRFQVQVSARRIEAVRFQAFGCPHTIAAAEWIAERLEGDDVEALAGVDVHAAARALEVPTEKLGKLLRIEDALIACWREYGRRDEPKGSE